MTKRLQKIRHANNPFTNSLTVKAKTKKINVSSGVSSQLGVNEDVFINHKTGEVLQTSVSTFKKVDDTEFTKLFVANIGLTFNLKSAGIKAFNLLMWCVQYHAINKDIVQLDEYTLKDFITSNTDMKINLSTSTLYRGLDELVDAQIIARFTKQGFYYINPSFCFNGDRVVFMNAIQRKRSNEDKS